MSLRAQDVMRTWNVNGTFRGVPVTIDGYTEPEGEGVATRTALQVLDTPLGQAAIYPVDSPKIAERGAMEELVFDGEFGQKFRVFARSPDTLRRWLTPEVRQVIVNFGTRMGGGVQSLEIGKDGLALKPKFNIGVAGSVLELRAGVKDVRDGLVLEGQGSLTKSYASHTQPSHQGHSRLPATASHSALRPHTPLRPPRPPGQSLRASVSPS